jgi:hypothetical protein
MNFVPQRRIGILIGSLLLLVLIAISILGLVILGSQQISLAIVIWVAMPLVCVPLAMLVVYRLYALVTVRYRLDREGFYLVWGLAGEQAPISAIERIIPGESLGAKLNPGLGLWWPGCVAGRRRVAGVGMVEFFSTAGPDQMVVVDLGSRALAISPGDLEAFQETFLDATRMGSLEPIPAISRRPDLALTRLWGDRVARLLVPVGMLVWLALLGYLGFMAPRLPAEVPFGFDALGQPLAYVPPGRLLLLPMIGGISWLGDIFLGAWLFRRKEERRLAYMVWTMPMLLGGILWMATLQMLTFP